MPDDWNHYVEQVESDDPMLDPARSRGGIFGLELALDAIDSYCNDRGLVLPVNDPYVVGTLPGFDEDIVAEVFARVDKDGLHPEGTPPIPRHVHDLIGHLAEAPCDEMAAAHRESLPERLLR